MTTERPMFPPVDSARRRFLTNAAGAAASGTVLSLATISPTLAAPAPDPIHAAIKRHQNLARAYDQAVKLRARCKDFGTLTEEQEARVSELNDLVDAAGLPLEAAAMEMFDTEPTTRDGTITALFYMRIQHRNDGCHMIEGRFEDEDGERYIDW